MKILSIFLLLYSFSPIFCQDKKIPVKNLHNSDSLSWYNSRTELVKELQLTNLTESYYTLYFRLWSNSQVLEIWKDDKDEMMGMLTSWTKEYTPANEVPTNRIHFFKIDLDTVLTSRLLKLIISTKINDLPEQDSIKGWQQGLDGITYFIETSTYTDYYLKSYWTPSSQGSLREAIIVQDFVDRAFEIVNAESHWKIFKATIPYECYINGGPGITCKILTKHDKSKYKRERNKYHRSIQSAK